MGPFILSLINPSFSPSISSLHLSLSLSLFLSFLLYFKFHEQKKETTFFSVVFQISNHNTNGSRRGKWVPKIFTGDSL
ncbi:hypothetical protein Lalb_Chr16g0391231 [Lupinus albus]|uniref:Uncharacterized protein n=1 Tax=Lupinus albus TaxID=3870 RepID=A0A6A4P596_LUPAL|nr:hypothetical protein Lalb_Chr16g0391231 [Lupinus albus]